MKMCVFGFAQFLSQVAATCTLSKWAKNRSQDRAGTIWRLTFSDSTGQYGSNAKNRKALRQTKIKYYYGWALCRVHYQGHFL